MVTSCSGQPRRSSTSSPAPSSRGSVACSAIPARRRTAESRPSAPITRRHWPHTRLRPTGTEQWARSRDSTSTCRDAPQHPRPSRPGCGAQRLASRRVSHAERARHTGEDLVQCDAAASASAGSSVSSYGTKRVWWMPPAASASRRARAGEPRPRPMAGRARLGLGLGTPSSAPAPGLLCRRGPAPSRGRCQRSRPR